MKLFSTMLLAACMACAGLQTAAADAMTAQKKADIEKLLDMTGALKMGRQFANALSPQMMQIVKSAHPEIPQKVIDIIPQEIAGVFKDHEGEMKTMLVELYGKYFSDPEIKQMIAFYATPVGQKSIQAMPSLMRESMLLGQQWGRSLAPEIQQRIAARFKSKGYKL